VSAVLTSDETLALATVLDKVSEDQARSFLGSFETYVDYVNARAKITTTASETIYAARAGRRAPDRAPVFARPRICGALAPITTPAGVGAVCAEPAGHAGMHETHDGPVHDRTAWTNA